MRQHQKPACIPIYRSDVAIASPLAILISVWSQGSLDAESMPSIGDVGLILNETGLKFTVVVFIVAIAASEN